MNILLLQPWHSEDNSYRARLSGLITYAPLTLATLSALIPKDLDCHVEVYDEIVGDFPLKKKKYDLVAISCLTSNAPRSYALA